MASKLSDVARRAGVSIATASRVLSDSSYRVTDDLRHRVLAAAESLHYVPNVHAQALVGTRTGVVGVIAHDMSDPYFSEITRGIQSVATEHGQLVMICNSYRDLERELAYIRLLHAHRVDALILAGSGLDNHPFNQRFLPAIEGFRATGGQVALIGRHQIPGDAVIPDNAGGARGMGQALVGLGHRKIGAIIGPATSTAIRDRLDGFRSALAEVGLALPQSLIEAGLFTRDGGFEATMKLLDRHPDLTAIFAFNDPMAIGVLAALHARGIRVPDDISVAGFDDIPIAQDVTPALSTVQMPMVAMGVRAMELALQRAGNEFRIEHFPTNLVLRASTARAPADD